MANKAFKLAIITGGSYGIGKACSTILAESGINIAILSRKRKEGIDTVDELKKYNIKVIHIETDVSNKEQVKKSVRSVFSEFGRIDILINNAGIVSPLKYFFEQSEEEWDQVIKVHLYGTYYMMKEVAPIMIRQKYGRIVNISSFVAQGGSCGRANYVSAKCGIEGLTMTAAKELGEYGITVNVVRPGSTLTPMTKARGYDFNAIAKKVPCQKIGDPEDIAQLVNFLIKEESNYITGQIITVDGGLSIAGVGLINELAPIKKLSD